MGIVLHPFEIFLVLFVGKKCFLRGGFEDIESKSCLVLAVSGFGTQMVTASAVFDSFLIGIASVGTDHGQRGSELCIKVIRQERKIVRCLFP